MYCHFDENLCIRDKSLAFSYLSVKDWRVVVVISHRHVDLLEGRPWGLTPVHGLQGQVVPVGRDLAVQDLQNLDVKLVGGGGRVPDPEVSVRVSLYYLQAGDLTVTTYRSGDDWSLTQFS